MFLIDIEKFISMMKITNEMTVIECSIPIRHLQDIDTFILAMITTNEGTETRSSQVQRDLQSMHMFIFMNMCVIYVE